MATELVLIRHGHAVRVQGNYVRAPLTETGRTQARLTGQRFCDDEIELDGFYTSPLRRARETAAIIGSRVARVPHLQNGVQELEGFEVPTLIGAEFLAHVGWFGRYLYENAGKPLHWPIVGRVSQAIVGLLAKHEGRRVGLVTHSGVISSVLAWYFPNQRRRWWTYTVDNCSLTRLRVDGASAELMAVNDTTHLSDALTTKQPAATTVQTAKQVEDKVEEIVLPGIDRNAMIK